MSQPLRPASRPGTPLAGPDPRRHARPARTLRKHWPESRMAAACQRGDASLTDAASDGPFPGLEHEWAVLTSYRVAIARQARDWPAAGQLQHALVSWRREWAAAALATPAGNLMTSSAAGSVLWPAVLHDLGQILREQNNPGCLLPYQEATGLCQPRCSPRGGHHRVEHRCCLPGRPCPA